MKRQSQRGNRRQIGWWIGGSVAVLAVGALVGWVVLRPDAAVRTEGSITTLVGRPAPVLRLPDADGKIYAVPERGRPTVLIFHMGIF